MAISKIAKSIERVINTGNYESIRVSVNIQEQVEWATPKDFKKKSDDLTKKLSDDLKDTMNIVMSQFSVQPKKVFGNSKPKVEQSIKVDDSILQSVQSEQEQFDSLLGSKSCKSKSLKK